MKQELTKEMFHEAAQLSAELVYFLNEKQKKPDNRMLLLSLAICYSTLAKGTDVTLHQAMELIMAIYKNTEIIKYD